MSQIRIKKGICVANDLGGGKVIRGTRRKTKLSDMEDRKTNNYDRSVNEWIKKNEKSKC
tara:strand:- start:1290 stop:1466 length:177 start_codon:yes stop_codon:yes gene_type:complete